MSKKLTEIAFFTDRVEDMIRFYQKFLGEEPLSAWPGGAIFMIGEVKLFIHETYKPTDDQPLPPVDHLAFSVADVDGTTAALVEDGLQMERAPAEYYWGRSAYLRDPAGHQIEITALSES